MYNLTYWVLTDIIFFIWFYWNRWKLYVRYILYCLINIQDVSVHHSLRSAYDDDNNNNNQCNVGNAKNQKRNQNKNTKSCTRGYVVQYFFRIQHNRYKTISLLKTWTVRKWDKTLKIIIIIIINASCVTENARTKNFARRIQQHTRTGGGLAGTANVIGITNTICGTCTEHYQFFFFFFQSLYSCTHTSLPLSRSLARSAPRRTFIILSRFARTHWYVSTTRRTYTPNTHARARAHTRTSRVYLIIILTRHAQWYPSLAVTRMTIP